MNVEEKLLYFEGNRCLVETDVSTKQEPGMVWSKCFSSIPTL